MLRLMRLIAPGFEEPGNGKARARALTATSFAGIALNLLLFAAKLTVGILSRSVAIVSDAVNNISDTASSLVALLGIRVAGRRPDREHPFGHGRAEYVSALIVAMLILLVAAELLKESVTRVFNPQPVEMSVATLAILAASALVKLGMFFFYRAVSRAVDSKLMEAASADSLSDAGVTSAILISAFLSARFGWNVDAPVGILVSLVILLGGVRIAHSVISKLLGGQPDPELVRGIEKIVLEGEGVTGVHDVIVHDYGPGRRMASAHAEVSADADLTRIHESIDRIERRIQRELNVPVVLHMDPVDQHCERTREKRAQIEAILSSVDPRFTMHDFRVVDEGDATRLIFDLAVPGELSEAARKDALATIERAAAAQDPALQLVIQVDSRYEP